MCTATRVQKGHTEPAPGQERVPHSVTCMAMSPAHRDRPTPTQGDNTARNTRPAEGHLEKTSVSEERCCCHGQAEGTAPGQAVSHIESPHHVQHNTVVH